MSNKISTIKERILYMLEIKGITKSKFFEKIGMTYGNFTGNSKKTPLNSDAIGNILLEIPDINPEWLITGKGEMLRDSAIGVQSAHAAHNENNTIYIELLEREKKENSELHEQIGELKNENKNLEKTVTALHAELECCKKENTELRTITHSQYNAEQKLYELPEVPAMLAAEPHAKYNKNVQKGAQK
ncbi:MAG: hypothetical protein LBK94_04855 [Prevotellaceae bacterium]|jgi:hypothetical protein|nr:hypothetical protein [Prevotellaceae bacterium]